MAESTIPVDLLNPGQVLACIGLVEAANELLGGAEAAYDWRDSGAPRFHLRAAGDEPPVARVLDFLERAEAIAEAPVQPVPIDWKASWGPSPRTYEPSGAYPFRAPSSPATFVCALVAGPELLRLDHWGDDTRDNVKFWAGAGGYPGAGLARDALELVRGRARAAEADPFNLAAPMSSSFRLDWRRDYIPLDAGFSLNKHSSISTVGYPLVELLAALGLAHARPLRPNRRNKLEYVYGVVGRAKPEGELWLPPSILRAALGAAELPFPTRFFRMLLDWPGQENQARAITTVNEELPHEHAER